MNPHLNILIPQWQGGGQDLSTYLGGYEIKKNYLQESKLSEVQVSIGSVSDVKNNMVGYDEIFKQLIYAKLEITKHTPKTIFTIGGGCDSDVAAISHLNETVNGDVTLLYFDAHGDLHTPESSESKFFYGMSLRTLLGDGDEMYVESLFSTLSPSQVIMLGNRDLDQAEKDYINDMNVRSLTIQDIELNIENVIKAVKEKGHKSIYVHIDLDVLDPVEFPHVPVPAPQGLKNKTLIDLLNRLKEEFHIIGLGLLEYSPSGKADNEVILKIVNIGINL
jgi:arginase